MYNVHQFIDHCLIPLYLWRKPLLKIRGWFWEKFSFDNLKFRRQKLLNQTEKLKLTPDSVRITPQCRLLLFNRGKKAREIFVGGWNWREKWELFRGWVVGIKGAKFSDSVSLASQTPQTIHIQFLSHKKETWEQLKKKQRHF